MATERLIIEIAESGARVVIRDFQKIGTTSAASAKGVDSMNKAIKGATTSSRGLHQALTILGIGSLAVGVRNAVSGLADFEDQMGAVRAVTGATGEEFEALRETAILMGQQTRFSATDAATGMQLLARAGFSAQQSMSTVDDVLRLKLVGSMNSMETATNVTIAALTGFRLNVSEAGRVTDVLAKAANVTNTSVEELGDALKLVGPIAAGVGVSLEETSAALGALSNAGLRGTLAGTGLRRVISELENPTRAAVRVLKDLGISSDSVKVSQVGLTEAIKRLRDAGVDAGTALQLFGDRGGPAFEVLANAVPEVEKLTGSLQKAAGESAKIAAVMDDTLKGSLLRAGNAVSTLVIRLGDLFASAALRTVLDAVSATVRTLTDNLGTLAVAFDGLVGVLGGGAAAIATFFERLPAAIIDAVLSMVNFVIRTINSFIRKVQLLLNNLITEVNRVGGNIGQNFDIRPVALGQFDEVTNAFEGSMEELGRVSSDAFAAGFEKSHAAQDALAKIINAQKLAREGGAVTPGAAPGTPPPTIIDEDQVTAAIAVRGALADLNLEVERQAKLLGKSAEQREISNRLFDAEQRLTERGVDLTTAENVVLFQQIEAQTRRLVVIERLGKLLDEIRGPQEQALQKQADLNTLYASGAINLETYNEQLRILAAETQRGLTVTDGLVDAFERVDVSAHALGETIAQALMGAIDQAAGALADFAISGFRNVEDLKKAFSDLFADLAKQILKIIIQTLILKAIQGAIGGAGAPVASALGGAGAEVAIAQAQTRQGGGPVTRNRPVVVGEKGPELFNPPTSGTITPNSSLTPEVNVSIVNVTDPDEVAGVLSSAQGEEVIMNVLSKNRQKLKGLVV